MVTRRLRALALPIGTAVVYVVAARLGFTMALAAAEVSPVWPPTGIAIAAVVLLGRRIWPAIAVGAFIANASLHEPPWTAAGIAAGNTLEAIVAGSLLARLAVRADLDRVRDVRAFLILAAGASTLVSATIGVTSLCAAGVHSWAAFGRLCWVWWVGDAMGALVVAPLVLVWATPAPRPTRRDVAEAVALLAGVVVVAVAAFGPLGVRLAGYPLHYTIFPFVIRAALRFRQRGATVVTAVASAIAVWGTVHGSGVFATASLNESLVALQLFMLVVGVTGLLLGAAVTERDTAEQRAADEYAQIRIGEERLRLALDAGRLGVWDWNIGTGDVKWSDNLETIHGLPPGGFPGTIEGFRKLVHPDDRARVEAAIARAVEERTGYDVEFRHLRGDGTVGWMAAKGRVVCDAAGKPVRMLGTGMDVTDRRRLEDELRARAQELVDADRRKDEFLAMLAHELRNPLAPLVAALHLLRAGSTERTRVLDMADRQVKQLRRLVDDLLDLSRITEGKIALRKEPVVLDEVVMRATETVAARVESRGQTLHVSLPSPPVCLEADAVRLAQIIANLLSNATEHTPAGGSITLGAAQADDELAIRVRDTGSGIAADLLPHVFDLFVQGDASLDRERGGLGIGLTIVRRLVELHGGRVEARSEGPGRGAEFTVHLPVRRTAPTVGARQTAARDAADTPSALRILLVEDNPDGADGIATVLRFWGHRVEVAFDAPSALAAADRFRPEVVLSDLGLPGMDGYELARRLRAGDGHPDAVLIALSGYGGDDHRRRSREAGFAHHVVKPPDLHALRDLLRGVGRVASPGSRD